MDVVSMSLGGPSPMGSVVEDELKACALAGMVVVCSAGNYGKDFGVLYPARYPQCLAVAAVDMGKVQGDFSAWGKELDVAAAGVEVWSTWPGGRYCQLDGTSMAAPHITGAAAILQAKARIREGKKDPPDITRLMLRRYAEDVGPKGPDTQYGCGVFSFGRFEDSDSVPREIVFQVGQKVAIVDGSQVELDVPPQILNNRTLVPIRFVAENMGWKVAYSSGKITMTKG
jgi:subtilisin family serine protease